MKSIINDSLRYWESRRPVYNAALALVVVSSCFANQSCPLALTWPAVAVLGLAAMVANVFYCAAYPVDLFLQASDYQLVWKRWRWALLVLGTLLAAGIYLLHP